MDMQLVSNKAALFFLKELDEKKGKDFKETKNLLKRKISGDNPSKDEWRKNINTFKKADVIDKAQIVVLTLAVSLITTSIVAWGFGWSYNDMLMIIQKAHAIWLVSFILGVVFLYVLYVYYIYKDDRFTMKINTIDKKAYDVADFIIGLLDKEFKGNKNCFIGINLRYSIKQDLEKYFGNWMQEVVYYKIVNAHRDISYSDFLLRDPLPDYPRLTLVTMQDDLKIIHTFKLI